MLVEAGRGQPNARRHPVRLPRRGKLRHRLQQRHRRPPCHAVPAYLAPKARRVRPALKAPLARVDLRVAVVSRTSRIMAARGSVAVETTTTTITMGRTGIGTTMERAITQPAKAKATTKAVMTASAAERDGDDY